MKLITPEISWHQKEPILSVHFCPKIWKLATAGADSTAKIWLVKEEKDGDDSVGIEFLSNLDRHAKTVNVVRFSPNGGLLATAGDDGTIILWKLSENKKNNGSSDFADDDVLNKEDWLVHKMLRGHIEDVYDLDWCPNGNQLVSGSVDNSAIVWDIEKGQIVKVLTDHKHYVQGVSWDPRDFYIATHSSDRTCRLYATSNQKTLVNIQRNTMSYEKDGKLVKNKYSRMFMDETMQSFFRRCAFSPDGSYLFLPAGLCDGSEKRPSKTTYVFARGQFKRPVCHLPGSRKATVCVSCSPIVYELMDDKENNVPLIKENKSFEVPYRMIFAVASLDSVTIYDTQHPYPIGYCANMHYASLTDLAWSTDGKLLVVSSTDGYCSFIKFEEGELGKPIAYDPIQFQVAQAKIRKKNKKDTKKESKKADISSKKIDLASKKLDQTSKKTDGSSKKIEASSVNGLENSNINSTADCTATPPKGEAVLKEKEKPTPKQKDSRQPTIDKLFTAPIRKRKRTNDGSPIGANGVMKSAGDITEQSKSQSASKEGAIQKQPKRVQVITLTSPEKNTPSIVPKVTVLEKSEATSAPKQAMAAPATVAQNPLTSPNKSFGKPTLPLVNPLVSPNKLPKRVSVTTLVTFPSSNTPKADTLLSPTPAPKSLKTITPSKSKCLAATPPSPSPLSPTYNLPKQPKRITVQTLETFSAEQKHVVELEKEEAPISTVPVQVDPPQLDDLTCTNSFDAPTVLTPTAIMEKVVPELPVDTVKATSSAGTGACKDESIVID